MNFRRKQIVALVLNLAMVLALAPSLAAAAEAPTYLSDILADLGQLEEKIVGLAKAIPPDKYSWRPAEGVRSISEALMHTASANFFFPSRIGTAPPSDVNVAGLEKITDKAEAIAVLQRSFDHLKAALEKTDEATLDDEMDLFGQKATVSGFLHVALTHCHEHLGQMIAYARSVGVTPPWSG